MLGRNAKPNKKGKPQGVATEPFTYIHRGTTVQGDLEASGRVRVHGTIRGNVRVHGVLEVAETGVIEGDAVEAEEVKILGRVRANVVAKGKIEIWKDGQLDGDVQAAALDIEEGARFTGRSDMRAEHPGETPRLPRSAAPVGERGLAAGEGSSSLPEAHAGDDERGEGGSAEPG